MTGRSDFDTMRIPDIRSSAQGPASTTLETAAPRVPEAPSASAPLLAAAIGGLLCLTACGSDGSSGSADTGDSGEPEERVVTLERVDPDMTEQRFKDACDVAMGTMETHPHCGGMNSCRGFSYDRTTQVYSEHTCKQLNNCTGWSCVVPEEKG
ncbi:MAG: hypothetical protein QM778_25185 [Myxococcales bacterium]